MSLRRSGARFRSIVGTGIVLIAIASLAACGAGEKSSSGTSASGASAAGVQQASANMKALEATPTWPDISTINGIPDLHGKTITYVALGDQIPVIHGIGVGVTDALQEPGATVRICDGKFNPTAVADCLKSAGDEQVAGVITSFVDYQMAAPAFEALAAKGIPVLLGGVAPSGGRQSDKTLAFFDNTPRVDALYEGMSEGALSVGGESTNVLWVKLMDSTTTSGASDKGVAKFKELCPGCGLAETEFTTANLDKLPSAVSAALVSNPETNVVVIPVDSFVPPALQGIQAANFAGKVKIVSSSSDLAGLQRIKDGQQAVDLGTPVLYEGWRLANAYLQLIAGETVEVNHDFVTRNFTPGNVGSLNLTPEAYLSDEWWGGDGYKAKFRAAWAQASS